MSKVIYSKLSDLVGTINASISTIFREKGSCWSSGWHNGIDIAAASGTPIKAVADGIVVNSDTATHNDGFGNRVILKHADGKATLYAHMIQPASVKVGQSVKRGQVIGKVGNTGLSYGAHLHFTVIDNYDRNPNIYYSGELLDPIKVCGLGSLKFNTSAGNVIVENGVSKNLGDLNKYYKDFSSVSQTVTVKPNTAAVSFKIGDIVNFTGSAHYANSSAFHSTKCKPGKAKITHIAKGSPHPYHLVAEKGGGSTVYGWVNAADILSSNFKPYTVRVTVSDLYIRSGAGANFKSCGFIKPGNYIIVEEKTGTGASLWGKLKSGAGWIALDYVTKV